MSMFFMQMYTNGDNAAKKPRLDDSNKKVVLAYSGGLDTSCIALWLKEQGYEVIAFMVKWPSFTESLDAAQNLGSLSAVISL